jgi:hypothetical protein
MDHATDERAQERRTPAEEFLLAERRMRIANLATALALATCGVPILTDRVPVEVAPARQE